MIMNIDEIDRSIETGQKNQVKRARQIETGHKNMSKMKAK